MTTIRAEIRQWRHNRRSIEGLCYGDTKAVYFDGEAIVILSIREILESPNFFIVVTDTDTYKLNKEERA